jgi:hypothetical protein
MGEISNWQIVSHNKRRAARHSARVPTSVTLAHRGTGLGHAERPPALIGYTKDLSAEGLALVVPSIRISEADLTELNRTLRIVLALPEGYVEIKATLVRYKHLHEADGEPGTETGYLIAARIKDMSTMDQSVYKEYIKGLD